ncbi:MAG: hypothetical protein Greene071436_266 [Parcubacteria group bacterium Greene0714_36]|nr:MAG: hypothetical protein Greene071436_266 [Parcubacteria group bacterium Greene0714_36]
MKYTPAQYAAALAAVLKKTKTASDRKNIAARLFRCLSETRMLKQIDRIVHEADRIMRREKGGVAVAIESAAPLSGARRREVGRALGAKAVITEAVNPRLLAGMRIIIDEETLIDATAQRRLQLLFSKNT